jgi:plastocyanin
VPNPVSRSDGQSSSNRLVWGAVVLGLAATAVFVPARIAYVRNQSHAAGVNGVTIVNFAFDPETLVVSAGTKVTFTNTDGAAHTATASDKSFDSGNLGQGQSFDVTVTKSIDYFCNIHQYMTGKIEVAG